MTEHPTIGRDELRRLADRATPGPWAVEESLAWGDRYAEVSPLFTVDEATDSDPAHACITPIDPLDAEFIAAAREAVPTLLDQIDQAEAERDEWRQTAQDEHAAALDLIGVVKDRERRIEAVRGVLFASDDGTEYEHNGHAANEGEPDCPACWVLTIRRALDGDG